MTVVRPPGCKPIQLACEIDKEQHRESGRQRRLLSLEFGDEVSDCFRPSSGHLMAQLRDEAITPLQQRDP
jgi:hypothetical protein